MKLISDMSREKECPGSLNISQRKSTLEATNSEYMDEYLEVTVAPPNLSKDTHKYTFISFTLGTLTKSIIRQYKNVHLMLLIGETVIKKRFNFIFRLV